MKAIDYPYDQQDVMPTGFSALDTLLGGGIHFRKILQISGAWSVGKSTLATQILATAQREDRPCVYADTELAWSNEYAKKIGVDVNKLDLIIGEYAEQYVDAIEEWANNHKSGIIVLDSIGGFLPKEEKDKGAENKSIGIQARMVASFCRKIVPIITQQNHALIIVNHQFTDISTGRIKASGGAKLEYAMSQWITLRRSFGQPARKTTDGRKTVLYIEAEMKKNKLSATEGMKCTLEMETGGGFATSPIPPAKRGRPPKV